MDINQAVEALRTATAKGVPRKAVPCTAWEFSHEVFGKTVTEEVWTSQISKEFAHDLLTLFVLTYQRQHCILNRHESFVTANLLSNNTSNLEEFA